MSFIKRLTPWINGNDVLPDDLNRYENALDEHERNKSNSSDIGILLHLKTTAKIIVNAINELFDNIALKLSKDDVINNLTTSDATKALAAPQGKALADQINILSKYPLKTIPDLNLQVTADYFSFTTTPLNCPTTAACYCEIKVWDNNNIFVEQILREIAFDGEWRRVKNAVGWQTWKKKSTQDKLDISLLNGWTNLDGSGNFIKVRKVGSIVFLSGILQAGVKTDGTLVASLPVGYRPVNIVRRILKQYNSTVFKDVLFEISVGGALTCYYATDSFYLFDFYFSVE